jgi:hypothetical protein
MDEFSKLEPVTELTIYCESTRGGIFEFQVL